MSSEQREIGALLAHVAGSMRTFVERTVAAHDVDRLYESRVSAESYLTHQDPKLRWAAIAMIAHHWGLDDVLKAACERLALDDPDANVRALAVSHLAHCYYQTDDPRVSRMIAHVVYNNAKPQVLRRAAYSALFDLRRSGRLEVAKRHLPTVAGFKFPDDVDWRFVDTFLFRAEGARTYPVDPSELLFR